MLKMVLRKEGETRIVLGLTAENVERMKAGLPVYVDLNDLNLHIATPVDDERVRRQIRFPEIPARDEPFETITAGVIAIDYAETTGELTTRWTDALRKSDQEDKG